MSDYISVQEAIEKINERARETFTLASGYEYYLGALHDVADDLRQMPTIDAVPVVRCGNCAKRGKNGKDISGGCPFEMTDDTCDPNAYCSYGVLSL